MISVDILQLWSIGTCLALLAGLNPLLALVALGLAVSNGRLTPRDELAWATGPYMLGLWSALLMVQVVADLYFVPATVRDRAYLDPLRVLNAYLHARLQSFFRPLIAAIVLAALPLPHPVQSAAVLGFVAGTAIYWATAWVREHVAISRGSMLLLLVEVIKNGAGVAAAVLLGWAPSLALTLLVSMITPTAVWAARLRREQILYPPYGGHLAPEDSSVV
ncbi:MAG TPA: hypothetical protein VEZ12_18510 [Herpetosiphonaceae bacterium]|nr:hypothetical protein [Herpetosiphonaceae bacterium]